MSPQAHGVNVVFRWYHDDVIALMPDLPASIDGTLCTCYVHLGQHGAADYSHVITNSRPAAPAEYEPLQRELEAIGYGVCVRARAGRRTY